MEAKNDNLLKIIIEEYIKNATPVGSAVVVEKYLPEVSPATIRNYMAELEATGLIFQPHTSAGRIPTTRGYQYYVDNFLSLDEEIKSGARKTVDNALKKMVQDRDGIKTLAKTLVELSDQAVLVGFGAHDVYYTGISNLFHQPEFIEQGLVYSMSAVIDHLDEVMAKIFDQTDEQTTILIGSNNPFGELSSIIMTRYHFGVTSGLIGILGPNRMNYRENIGLINYSREALKKINKK